MLSPAPSAKPQLSFAAAAALVVVTLVVYLPAFRGGFIFDDNVFLTANPLIAARDGLWRFWFSREAADYWPVTASTLWFEWRLWGMNAAGYHATNVILHIGEILLFWAVLRKLRVPGAFLGALIFAVHPLNAESVVWITQRKNLMAMLFYLLSIFWFCEPDIDRRETVASGASKSRKGSPAPVTQAAFNRSYWFSFFAFVLGMLSKGSVVILPPVLLGIVLWSRRPTKRDVLRLAPFFVAACALAAFESTFSTVDAPVPVQPIQWVERLLRAGLAVWFYLGKCVWPGNLCFDYGLWVVRTGDLLWWLPLGATVAVTLVLWSFRRSWARPILFAWSYFCVALIPVLGFAEVGFMRYSLVSNHYVHLALLGLAALAGAGGARLSARATRLAEPIGENSESKNPESRSSNLGSQMAEAPHLRSMHRGKFLALAVVLVSVLGVLAWQQAVIYSDGERLYRDTIARNPSSWLAHTNLGVILTLAEQYEPAIAELEVAVRINPDFAKAQDDLGVALYHLGRVEEAMGHYLVALRLDPYFVEAHNNFGAALARSGHLGQAIEEFKQALRIDPDYANARSNLDRAEKMQGGKEGVRK